MRGFEGRRIGEGIQRMNRAFSLASYFLPLFYFREAKREVFEKLFGDLWDREVAIHIICVYSSTPTMPRSLKTSSSASNASLKVLEALNSAFFGSSDLQRFSMPFKSFLSTASLR